MKNLNYFNNTNFFDGASSFFKDLNIPLKSIDEHPYRPEDFLSNTYNPNSPAHSLVEKAYLLGIVDDDALENESRYDSLEKIAVFTEDYEGLTVVGVELKTRENDSLPSRSQLAEITRAINREFLFTPVTVLFKYDGYLALANAERTSYLVKYKEGEKVGKVSLLRDVKITNPHTGHLQILNDLRRPDKVKTFTDLYKHWGDIFSVNVLNKKFYQELSNWYFWAIQNVTFPGQPTPEDALLQGKNFKDLKQQHNATNVIRMLTRLLFVWFMKEKNLIPEELFDLKKLQNDILNDIEPLHEKGLFTERNKDSVYYKAILQNLFFATLNCPIKSDFLDKRKREFRKNKFYGQDRGNDWMFRYSDFFKNPDAFLELLNNTTPFLNGGLFECLDDKNKNIYIDGFSDQMTKGEQLIVPDYLFFGLEEEADLSDVIGIADKKTKTAAVKGLVNILKSYKFTITENTPIEEEVALDPELLGKVFENLLASYNPETKTTARKQTGSFYTPRQVVNYMVDESLIAYLKNKIQSADVVLTEFGKKQSNLFGNEGVKGQVSLIQQHSGSELKDDEALLDKLLHQLVNYSSENPFRQYPEITKIILQQLDHCTILDPACGSGAFPMGILQKMVYILEKLDPENRIWKEVQIDKAKKESEDAFGIEDKQAREDLLLEINGAFDQNVNNPDYARKLFLIENCIYGVDIQPIATQISKLRFFISLVVEQKVDRSKNAINFGIRPLPNLETKFVAANTLIGIDKPKMGDQISLGSDNQNIENLKRELAVIRHKLFSAKTKETKLKYRESDQVLRNKIAEKLKENFGWSNEAAGKLAAWDPFDQNVASSFFDPEWMFNIKVGFDIVIGNPPYVQLQKDGGMLAKLYQHYKFETFEKTGDIYSLFYERGVRLLNKHGFLTYITSNKWMRANYGASTREFFAEKTIPLLLIDFANLQVFETATVDTNILMLKNKPKSKNHENNELFASKINIDFNLNKHSLNDFIKKNGYFMPSLTHNAWVVGEKDLYDIKGFVESKGKPLFDWDLTINRGVVTGYNDAFIIPNDIKDEIIKQGPKSAEIMKPILRGKDISTWYPNFENLWLINSHNGIKLNGVERINIENDYPSVFKWFLSHKDKMIRRQDQGDHWTNLRNCAYIEDFTKPKIIYREITQKFDFVYDSKGEFYFIDTAWMMVGKHLKYLTCIFNSQLFKYCFSDNFTDLGGSGRRLKKVFFQKIPIKTITNEEELPFIKIVEYLVALKNEKLENDTDKFILIYFEQIANALVFEWYFNDEFEQAGLSIAKYLEELPDLNDNEIIIHQLRKIYITVNQENHPIHQAIFSMLSIPQIELIMNNN